MGNPRASEKSVDILIIDDDVELCELVTEYLETERFLVESIHQGEEGLRRALENRFQLIVLDVMLPGINGFEVLRRLRSQPNDTPVLMLTARGDDVDRIVGLEIGADDYLPKPFNPRELVARIHAILRRSSRVISAAGAGPGPVKIAVGDVVLDPGTYTVWRGGNRVELTAVEFNLLETLLRSAGQVLSRGELSRKVLERELSPLDRSLDMHVSQLRKKLGPRMGQTERIKTIRGVGYLYCRPDSAEED